MKHLLILLFTFFCCSALQAQNLVSNPSFATYSNCPYDYSQLHFATNWQNGNLLGTSDYYNFCASADSFDVPQNISGYQTSASGSYAGILMYHEAMEYREYLSGKVAELIPGRIYKVSVVVSLADSSRYATDGLGVYFTNAAITDMTFIAATPQVDFSDSGIIRDKTNWKTLTATFLADSVYTRLVIGGFKHDADLHFDTLTYPVADPDLSIGAYYYIDSVSVEQMNGTGIQSVDPSSASYIYPNPVTETSLIHFNYTPSHTYQLEVYDISGRYISSTTDIDTDSIPISKNKYRQGLYYYKLKDNYTPIATGKFIIQ